MSRIRSVKPEFWTSDALGRVSRDARLTFIGLWNEADDDGRLVNAPKRLAGALFPFDADADAEWIDARIDELVAVGVLRRYEVDGRRLLCVPSFKRHQHPDKPRASVLPAPVGESSPTPPRLLPDSSPTVPANDVLHRDATEPLPDSSPTPPRLLPDESGGDRDRDRELELDREGRGGALARTVVHRFVGQGGINGFEAQFERASWVDTTDALIARYGGRWSAEYPSLDGKPPRLSIAKAVAAKWGWFKNSRARFGVERDAIAQLEQYLAEMAERHRISWERDGGKVPPAQTQAEKTAAHLKLMDEHAAKKARGEA